MIYADEFILADKPVGISTVCFALPFFHYLLLGKPSFIEMHFGISQCFKVVLNKEEIQICLSATNSSRLEHTKYDQWLMILNNFQKYLEVN